MRVKRNGVMWFDGELLNLQKRREYWHNKYCRSKSDADRNKYIECRNRFRSRFRKKKSEFFQTLINEGKSSPRSLWAKLSPILNRNKKTGINTLNVNGKCYNASSQFASLFLHVFSSVLNGFIFKSLTSCLIFSRTYFGKNRIQAPDYQLCLNRPFEFN